MQRGDIYHVNLPIKPLPGASPLGHVQSGPRPAVIVQHGGGSPNLSTVLIVPITGSQKKQFQYSLFVQPSPTNGLTVPSTILTHQLRAVDKSLITDYKGKLDPQLLQSLIAELKAILSL